MGLDSYRMGRISVQHSGTTSIRMVFDTLSPTARSKYTHIDSLVSIFTHWEKMPNLLHWRYKSGAKGFDAVPRYVEKAAEFIHTVCFTHNTNPLFDKFGLRYDLATVDGILNAITIFDEMATNIELRPSKKEIVRSKNIFDFMINTWNMRDASASLMLCSPCFFIIQNGKPYLPKRNDDIKDISPSFSSWFVHLAASTNTLTEGHQYALRERANELFSLYVDYEGRLPSAYQTTAFLEDVITSFIQKYSRPGVGTFLYKGLLDHVKTELEKVAYEEEVISVGTPQPDSSASTIIVRKKREKRDWKAVAEQYKGK